jgi:DHA1 family bicyclomycin/chloramphenicol resistance-like MFS transporter
MGWVVGALAVAVSVTGLLGANCVGLLMQRFAQASGAAAALFGASQFGLGMLASAAVSALHDGSGRPMGWVMLACLAGSAAGFVGFWRAR